MIKVFSIVKFQFQFKNDEVSEFCIQCNSCNKTVTCKFFEPVTIEIFPVFIKAVVFDHVGLSWIIETKEQYECSIEEHSI